MPMFVRSVKYLAIVIYIQRKFWIKVFCFMPHPSVCKKNSTHLFVWSGVHTLWLSCLPIWKLAKYVLIPTLNAYLELVQIILNAKIIKKMCSSKWIRHYYFFSFHFSVSLSVGPFLPFFFLNLVSLFKGQSGFFSKAKTINGSQDCNNKSCCSHKQLKAYSRKKIWVPSLGHRGW